MPFKSGHMKSFKALAASAAVLSFTAAVSTAMAEPFDMQVGGAAVVKPKYEGSKDYEVTGFPIIAPAGVGDNNGFVQFRGLDDVRFRLFNPGGFEAGVLGGYRFGRDEDDADRLDGLGDVDGGLVVGGYAAYNFGFVKPFISYHHQVTGEDGALMRLGAETRIPLSGGITLLAIAGTTYANDDYMDAYFSVTPGQAAASTAGLGVYDADAGFKDIYLSLGTDIPLTPEWSLKVAGQYSHLIGDAADSPIVETSNQFTGLLGLTYRFSIDR